MRDEGHSLRVEIGPKDIEKGSVVLVRRDNFEKDLRAYGKARKPFRTCLRTFTPPARAGKAKEDARITTATDFETFKQGVQKGFVRAMWCGDTECEAEIKQKTGATSRCMPFGEEQERLSDCCVHCGKRRTN